MPLVPLIDQQRRMTEVGRIRLGKKVPTQNGKSRPAKLDKFRLTSRDKHRLDAAAALYGGDVVQWEGEWELYTDAAAIPIAVVPGQALNVSYEQWGQKTKPDRTKTPVICLRRCDGAYEAKSDGPCLCAQQEDMTCKPTARLSVVLTDVPGLGVWRLESHGWNALTELQGTVQLLEMLVAAGRPVRARLRLDKRESPNEAGTRKFVVPVIDIDHTMGQVLDSLGYTPAAQVEQGSAPAIAGPGFTPVPELPAAPAPSIGAQMAAVEAPPAPSTRRNQQQPIAPTGLAPRRADEIAGGAPAPLPGDGGAAGSEPVAAVSDPAPPTSDADDRGSALPLASRIAMWIGELDPPDDMKPDEFRHAFLAVFSEGEYSSAKDVPSDGDTIAKLRAAIARYHQGRIRLVAKNGAWAFVDGTGLRTDDPAGEHQRSPVAPVREYSKMKVAELAEECRNRGIEPAGTKAELIALLEGTSAA